MRISPINLYNTCSQGILGMGKKSNIPSQKTMCIRIIPNKKYQINGDEIFTIDLHRDAQIIDLNEKTAKKLIKSLSKNEYIIVGRSKDCDYVVENMFVSSQHLLIGKDKKGQLYVEDLKSTNGTMAYRPNKTAKGIAEIY